MKSQELLDIFGDVDEKYVLAADEKVVRPRFRWQPWAACAACAALICVAAWPHSASNTAGGASADLAPMAAPAGDGGAAIQGAEVADDEAADTTGAEAGGTVIRSPGLHAYTLIEDERQIMTTATEDGLPKKAVGVDDAALEAPPEPAPNADGAASGGSADAPADIPQNESGADGTYQAETAVNQDEASAQYQNLLQNGGIGREGDCPEWFAGAWLDNDWPDNTARLTVAIVDGYRTPAMESQVKAWCGGTGDVLFCGAKYSAAYLDGLLDEVCGVFDQYGWIPSVLDANEVTNRVEVDLLAMPSDDVLAALDGLDPEGDAIYVQVFIGRTIQFTDGTAEDGDSPAPDCPEYDLLDGVDE